MTRLVVPNDAIIDSGDIDGGSAFTAAGNGRSIGFVLRPAAAPATESLAIVGQRYGHCFDAGCAPAATTNMLGVSGYARSATGEYAVPAGTYDVYLIPDGGPASVTLKLRGLSGATIVRPDVPVQAQIGSASGSGAGFAAFNGGTTQSVGAPGGLVFVGTPVSGQGPGAGSAGACIYDGPPGGGQYRGCRSAQSGTPITFERREAGPIRFVVPTMALVGPSDQWTSGGYLDAGMASWATGAVSLALTYANLPAPDPTTGGPGVGDPGGTQSAPPGSVVSQGAFSGGGPSAPTRREQSASRTGCRTSVRAKRLRGVLTVVAATSERCRLALTVYRGRRRVASRTLTIEPNTLRLVRLRAPRRVKVLRLVVESTDGAGTRSRRTLRVRASR